MRGNGNSRGRGRGRYRDSHRHHREGRERGAIEGVPILYPPTSKEYDATKNGIQIVKEKLSTHFALHYGRRGRFIADDEYHQAVLPDIPNVPYDPGDIQSMIFWDAHKTACTQIVKEGLKMNSEKVEWFAFIISILSTASKDLVEAEDDWADTELEQDPLQLWRIVERTHLTNITGSTDIDRHNAMETYNSCRQERNESSLEYKKRFERAVSALERVEHPDMPSERMKIIKWIRGLNDKHQEWKNKIANDLQGGMDPPDSLEDAIRLVRNYVPMQSSRRGTGGNDAPATAFLVEEYASDNDSDATPSKNYRGGTGGRVNLTTDKNKKRTKGAIHETERKHQKTNEINEEEDSTPEPSDKQKCYTCGKPGHNSFKCPLKNQIHQLVREGKIHMVTPMCLHEDDGDTILRPMDVLIDDGANVSVFWNRDLLANIEGRRALRDHWHWARSNQQQSDRRHLRVRHSKIYAQRESEHTVF